MADRSLAILAFVFCTVPVPAQTTSTEVLGTVADSSGSVIPNAKVTLLRISTGDKRQTVTDSNGNYSFPLIEIGDYTVTVGMEGFKTQTKTGITVELQQKALVDNQLEVSSASERGEVVATNIELKTAEYSLRRTIQQNRVTKLPAPNR